ncbi:MAG: lipopolysaccharide heptosyltransferase I [gamma proteobacterium symbiont of Bathyaustriella thionipta]|nr:lipopolysaccharide heptosyltransferase I [gamma proteobacterium symbiont of Bathyaustriella thionipta]MCU7948681.1 lipopolysaccharide heptosyltransferase I [gamma proteobacterium symbiont of Bathyaustriella thionipta]MCU7952613.1 lipopolysaccharide heptosyltransferase I [gamma proteobacterium symbiont of Bathyaustriella thionipta]MCU7955110.1 lipopolysaccharide heptosyltransferase I [gamma proteobacterium symbiont of Bathyaustriella thionipta]MCU7966502.1 lipopolysaccharide heptosyltransfera
MKTVLIIKTSSLGDVIHTLPALTDARKALGDIQFDWLVEENFAEIPAWHPAVRKVIPVAIRRWRKQIFKTFFSVAKTSEWQHCKQQIQQQHYDSVIDAQGLLKSAVLTRFAQGETYGLDKQSAREPIAAYFYKYPQSIAREQHAVARVRQLFAKCLGYELDDLPLDYGIKAGITEKINNTADAAESQAEAQSESSRTLLFLHGTTWYSKHWPEQYWFELADQVTAQGDTILLPWGNKLEYQRALKIKQQCTNEQQVFVLDKMDLNQLVQKMMTVDAVVAVDTGLAHLAAALDKPTVALYGPTSPGLTGTYGNHQIHLQADYDCAPCFNKQCSKTKNNINPECYTDITPQRVMTSLNSILK